MHLEKLNYYQQRADVFLRILRRDIVTASVDLNAEYFVTNEPVSFSEAAARAAEFTPIQAGTEWGRDWECAWFRLTGRVPREWKGNRVEARLNLGGEGLVFTADGTPLQGITTGSVFHVNFVRDRLPLIEDADGDEPVELMVDAAVNSLMGLELDMHPRLDTRHPGGKGVGRLEYAQLCMIDDELQHLVIDIELALSLLKIYTAKDYRYRQILMTLNRTVDIYKGDPKNAGACRDFLQRNFFNASAAASALTVTAVGHAHIDSAWLWPMRETIRKCGRTFASQVALLKRYPDYVFGASQPLHYRFVQDHYPKLFTEVKAAVATGRWELQGGMWVEADCNLISGESMVRQFLHGKNYYMDEFGVDVTNLWIPDVFGYSAALPQIMKKSGCDYFITQKMSWNTFNQFPHNTFRWRGLDGSEVLTHFPPENTYNGAAIPEALSAAQDRFPEADTVDEFMSLFGVGDGGGGPREDHIERLQRMADLEGCPKVRFGRADEFFKRIEAFHDDLEVWQGELYLEKHQGTLTSQARAKKNNRRLEYLLKHVEFVFACLSLSEYPSDTLDDLWKTLLTNQFHDIIPGSSITRVYDEMERDCNRIDQTGRQLLDTAAKKLFEPDSDAMTVFNPTGYDYHGMIELPEHWHSACIDGEPLECQRLNHAVVADIAIPPFTFLTMKRGEAEAIDPVAKSSAARDLTLENNVIRYEFNRDAQLVRAYDKALARELIDPERPANVLSLYHDDPPEYDAWDIDLDYENQWLQDAVATRATKTVDSQWLQVLEFELEIGRSTIRQQIKLGRDRRLDFVTDVDWNEAHHMMRSKFPHTIRTGDAAFDIQFGYCKRDAARNTSWDVARYEVPAHRYVDVSDTEYGVTLLNDGKYGYKVFDHTLDLNLLRSPKYPDFTADLGAHRFTYSFLPHQYGLIDSTVFAHAAALNQPPLRFPGFTCESVTLPCIMDSPDITLETIKKAAKEDCLVVRLVENKGCRSTGTLHLADGLKTAVKTNAIEWNDQGESVIADNRLQIELDPFEIRTYKLRS